MSLDLVATPTPLHPTVLFAGLAANPLLATPEEGEEEGDEDEDEDADDDEDEDEDEDGEDEEEE